MSQPRSSAMEIPVDSLRAEIVESQKSGAEFLKWKLIATATVASILAGVGQEKTPPETWHYLVFLIPLICAYVDLVSLDLAIRILAIGAFLRSRGDAYERWVQTVRTTEGRNPFAFAPIAVHGSSIAISLTMVVASLWFQGPVRTAYLGAGLGGTAIAAMLWALYRSRAALLAAPEQTRATSDPFLHAAIEEARRGLDEGGIPIGSVLVVDGKIIGRGHNRRVQNGSAILHGEMDALENAGRLPSSDYRRAVLYTTLSPCAMCSGAILLYGIPRVVVAENRNFMGEEALLRSRGVTVDVVGDPACIEMMRGFISSRPELWNEDIGE